MLYLYIIKTSLKDWWDREVRRFIWMNLRGVYACLATLPLKYGWCWSLCCVTWLTANQSRINPQQNNAASRYAASFLCRNLITVIGFVRITLLFVCFAVALSKQFLCSSWPSLAHTLSFRSPAYIAARRCGPIPSSRSLRQAWPFAPGVAHGVFVTVAYEFNPQRFNHCSQPGD